jgi:hypothetical protein
MFVVKEEGFPEKSWGKHMIPMTSIILLYQAWKIQFMLRKSFTAVIRFRFLLLLDKLNVRGLSNTQVRLELRAKMLAKNAEIKRTLQRLSSSNSRISLNTEIELKCQVKKMMY